MRPKMLQMKQCKNFTKKNFFNMQKKNFTWYEKKIFSHAEFFFVMYRKKIKMLF